jgi:hypothetical protein
MANPLGGFDDILGSRDEAEVHLDLGLGDDKTSIAKVYRSSDGTIRIAEFEIIDKAPVVDKVASNEKLNLAPSQEYVFEIIKSNLKERDLEAWRKQILNSCSSTFKLHSSTLSLRQAIAFPPIRTIDEWLEKRLTLLPIEALHIPLGKKVRMRALSGQKPMFCPKCRMIRKFIPDAMKKNWQCFKCGHIKLQN